jgi:hypothetical protein
MILWARLSATFFVKAETAVLNRASGELWHQHSVERKVDKRRVVVESHVTSAMVRVVAPPLARMAPVHRLLLHWLAAGGGRDGRQQRHTTESGRLLSFWNSNIILIIDGDDDPNHWLVPIFSVITNLDRITAAIALWKLLDRRDRVELRERLAEAKLAVARLRRGAAKRA